MTAKEISRSHLPELLNSYKFPTPLVYNSEKYLSLEQLLFAMQFHHSGPGPDAYAEGIRQCRDAEEIRALGRMQLFEQPKSSRQRHHNKLVSQALAAGVRPKDLSAAHVQLLLFKFQQKEHCRRVLLSTGDSVLVVKDNERLGGLLMEVREVLASVERRRERHRTLLQAEN
jgi:predicted NAD-dependent protein-ADP-ribosyltransferase YbiA (DUF1768 family)